MTGERRRRRLRGPAAPDGPVVVGLETGGDHLGVALWHLPAECGTDPYKRWRLIESVQCHRGHRHADALLGVVDTALNRHGLTSESIGLVTVGRGPGGFTGIRVGLATAVGLAMGLDRPLWTVDSLAALALNGAAAGPDAVLVPMIDARRGQVFSAAYVLDACGTPTLLTPQRVIAAPDLLAEATECAAGRPLVVFGSGALTYDCATLLPGPAHIPSAAMVAWLGARAWDTADRDSAHAPPVDPVYLRPSDAEIAADAGALNK